MFPSSYTTFCAGMKSRLAAGVLAGQRDISPPMSNLFKSGFLKISFKDSPTAACAQFWPQTHLTLTQHDRSVLASMPCSVGPHRIRCAEGAEACKLSSSNPPDSFRQTKVRFTMAIIRGTSKNDTLRGTPHNDTL